MTWENIWSNRHRFALQGSSRGQVSVIHIILTESIRMLEALKSRYMTFVSALCKNASPFAAPSATFIRRFQESGWKYEPPVQIKTNSQVQNYTTKIQ